MSSTPFQPGVIQPGMEQVIEAGDTLEVTDNNGKVFAIAATEAPETVAFCQAFDEWFMLNEKAKVSAVSPAIINGLWVKVKETYNNLPPRLQRQLPSFKSIGITVPPHRH